MSLGVLENQITVVLQRTKGVMSDVHVCRREAVRLDSNLGRSYVRLSGVAIQTAKGLAGLWTALCVSTRLWEGKGQRWTWETLVCCEGSAT